MNIGCHIYKDFERPDKKLIEAFSKHAVANIDDCMGRIAAVSWDIKRIGNNSGVLAGPAFTVKVPEGDNLMFHKALDLAQPGDIIMIDAGGSPERSILGEIMANYLRLRKIAGIVVDGSIRDAEEIGKMADFFVYAKGVTPNGPYKNGPGEIRGIVTVGQRVVHPGDIVVGDGDGVIVIPLSQAQQMLEKVNALKAAEQAILDTMERDLTYVRPWVDQKLTALGCTED